MRKICKECFKRQHPDVRGICPVELIPASEVKVCPVWSVKERREYHARKTTV